jgi:hypothetical protein
MSRITAVLIILIFCLGIYAGAAQGTPGNSEKKGDSGPAWDWLGVYPVYSYNGLLSPYYPYYYPTYSQTWRPASFYPTYLVQRYSAYPWWIGPHYDLGKTMQIARSSSSVRVYSQGAWQTP